MVVGRRAAAGEGGQEFLVPGNLPDSILTVLEEVADLGPLIEESADPCPGDQSDAGLDTAGPVHAGQERVRTPPGAQLIRGRLGVTLVLA